MAAPTLDDFNGDYEADPYHQIFAHLQQEPPQGVVSGQFRCRPQGTGEWTVSNSLVTVDEQEAMIYDHPAPGTWEYQMRWFGGTADGLPGEWSVSRTTNVPA